MRQKWTEDHINFLYENWRTMSQREIAKQLGRPHSTVNAKMMALDLVKPKGTDFNHNFFSEWTRESAYWIGFTLADGSVTFNEKHNDLCWRLGIKDVSHLELLKRYLNTEKNLYYHEGTASKALTLSSKKACSDLSKLGIVTNKSNAGLLVQPPPEYFWHFLRGFIDGDGGIYWRPNGQGNMYLEATMCFGLPSVDQCHWTENNLKLRGFKPKRSHQTHIHILRFFCENAKEFCRRLYMDSKDLRLKRKYINYLKSISTT
jgi:hypothetical protein